MPTRTHIEVWRGDTLKLPLAYLDEGNSNAPLALLSDDDVKFCIIDETGVEVIERTRFAGHITDVIDSGNVIGGIVEIPSELTPLILKGARSNYKVSIVRDLTSLTGAYGQVRGYGEPC